VGLDPDGMTLSKVFVRAMCVGMAVLSVGCASHAPPSGGPASRIEPGGSLETYIRRVRSLAMAARPPRPQASTLEARDPEIREALKALAAAASTSTHRRVAEAYRQAGVLDAAYDHYTAALVLDKGDPASYDGLARVWRDWGFPELGMGDARRAIFYAPDSAAAYNTFGTLLQALGLRSDAHRAFERALALDPQAAYAWTNLCYLSFQSADIESALASCRRAIALEPGLNDAHNNLGLVYAANGDLAAAAAEFSLAGGDAGRQYNIGIVLSASRRYSEAAAAFEAAQMLRPDWTSAAERARQSRRRAQQPGSLSTGTSSSHVRP
jgi:tetratricopeptide (TPR) repeat protein